MMKKLLFSLLTLLSFAIPSHAQQGVRSHRFTIAGPDAAINLINTGIAYHKITWNVSGTASACTIALDTSANGTTWTAGGAITGQVCTSNGASAVVNVNANYVRMNMTALTVSAGSSVTVTWNGWTTNPGGGGSGTISCAISGGIGFETAVDTLGCDSELTWDNTAKQATVGIPDASLDTIIHGWINNSELGARISSATSAVGLGGVAQNTGTAADGAPEGVVGLAYINAGTPGAQPFHVATGVDGTAWANHSSNGAALAGSYNQAFMTGTGNIGTGGSSMTGSYHRSAVTAGVVGAASGIYIDRNDRDIGLIPAGGTITNEYGLFIETQANTHATNTYAIHLLDQGTSANGYVIHSLGGRSQFNLGASQVLPIIDVNSASTSTLSGLVDIRGDGIGDCDGEGDSCLLHIAEESGSDTGAIFSNEAGTAGLVGTIDMGANDHFNLSSYNADFSVAVFNTFNPVSGTFSIGTGAGVTAAIFDASQNALFSANVKAVSYSTATNCADSAGAAACGSAAAGAVVIDAAATTVVVSTTAVTANSEIFVQYDSSLSTRLGITCNTTVALPAVTARTAATSFTITVPVAPAVNPACYSYHIVN